MTANKSKKSLKDFNPIPPITTKKTHAIAAFPFLEGKLRVGEDFGYPSFVNKMKHGYYHLDTETETLITTAMKKPLTLTNLRLWLEFDCGIHQYRDWGWGEIKDVAIRFLKKNDTANIPTVTKDETKVLNCVCERYPQESTSTDIENAIRVTRKTVGKILNRLKEQGLVTHPVGKTKRWIITQQGRAYVEEFFS